MHGNLTRCNQEELHDIEGREGAAMNTSESEHGNTSNSLSVGELRDPLELIALVARRTYEPLRRESSNNSSMLVERTVRYVLKNYADDIRLDDLAAEVELSKFHFVRKFRKETGITPVNFLRRLRIVRAMKLLIGSDYTIGRIAQEVGYSDRATFSRAFLRTAGTQPSLYRHARLQPVGQAVSASK